jgi:hypothetical protein
MQLSYFPDFIALAGSIFFLIAGVKNWRSSKVRRAEWTTRQLSKKYLLRSRPAKAANLRRIYYYSKFSSQTSRINEIKNRSTGQAAVQTGGRLYGSNSILVYSPAISLKEFETLSEINITNKPLSVEYHTGYTNA